MLHRRPDQDPPREPPRARVLGWIAVASACAALLSQLVQLAEAAQRLLGAR